jgi:hypothetical protein
MRVDHRRIIASASDSGSGVDSFGPATVLLARRVVAIHRSRRIDVDEAVEMADTVSL